jgi:hypothetical protein
VEERKSWLPAGLEGSGWEPDDRASQRSGARSKQAGSTGGASSAAQPQAKGSAEDGPSASSGPWQPYDPDRPESKRSGTSADSEPAKAAPQERSEPEAKKGDAAQAKGDEPTRGERDDDGKADDDREERPDADRDRDGQEGGRSDVDAMGQDKHRTVIGQRYGASRTKQLAYYGAFVAFVIAAYLGLQLAVDHFDKAPAHDRDQAPWSQKNAPDEPLGGFTPRTKGEKGPTNFQ